MITLRGLGLLLLIFPILACSTPPAPEPDYKWMGPEQVAFVDCLFEDYKATMAEEENPARIHHLLAFSQAEQRCGIPARQTIPEGEDWGECSIEAQQLLRSRMNDLSDEAVGFAELATGGSIPWELCTPLDG